VNGAIGAPGQGKERQDELKARQSLLTGALLLLLGNLASRLLGLAREQVIAAFFGETAITSAFGTAATVPTMFYDLVVGGAVSAALVPVLSGYVDADDRTELGEVVGTLLVGGAGVLLVLVSLLALAAAPLASVLGASTDPAVYETTVAWVRLVVPALFFLGLAGIVGAVCYAGHRVAFPAFAIALFNGGLVLTIVALHGRIGGTSMVVGVLVGAVLQLGAVVPGLAGIPIRWHFHPRHPAVARMLRLYAPVAAGLVISEIGVGIDRNLAWQTGATSVAIMRFATQLVQLPLGLVATATSLAALPVLARLLDDPAEFRRTLSSGLRLALLAILPCATFLVVFSQPIVRLLYERGAFGAADTATTSLAFLLYAPQLPFVAVDQLLIFAFYARKNTLTPMLVGLAGVGLYLGCALMLIGPFHLGVNGLILANTIQNSLHAVALLLLLSRETGSLAGYGVGQTAARGLLAGLGAGLVGFATRAALPVPHGLIGLATYLALAGVVVLGAYVVGLRVLGVEEISSLPKLVRSRLRASNRSSMV
jgi:putative peptidoglycan lipid II flippase